MGNKSGVLVAKIFLWMLEMLLKWAPKINSFPGKAFRVTQWKLSSRWGAKQPGSSFRLTFFYVL